MIRGIEKLDHVVSNDKKSNQVNNVIENELKSDSRNSLANNTVKDHLHIVAISLRVSKNYR